MAHLFSSFFFFFFLAYIYLFENHTEQAKKLANVKWNKKYNIIKKKESQRFLHHIKRVKERNKTKERKKSIKMYNFNTSLSTPPLLGVGVGVDFCSNTPRTPEILNSLIAMTNPFEYSYASVTNSQSQIIPTSVSTSSSSIFNNNCHSDISPVIACKMENSFLQQYDNNSQSNCSSSSSLESPSNSANTPLHLASTISSTTPSLQQVMIKY